jgi:hypothetical protein
MILNEGIFDKPNEEIKALIFLDHDGVICIDFNKEMLEDMEHPFNDLCIRNLEYIIQNTNAHIVVSSSWRQNDLEWLRQVYRLRNFKYPERIIGETMRAYQFVQKGCHLPIERGTEIKAWYDKFIKYEKGSGFTDTKIPYVIIDDNSDMLLSQKDNFVHTDTKKGLTLKDAEKAILILKR